MSEASAHSIPGGFASALSAWLPVVLWASFIAWTSGDQFGGSSTLVWVRFLMKLLSPDASEAAILTIHAVVRKLAHLAEYAVLAGLLVRALRSRAGLRVQSPVTTAVGFAVAAALLDEGNQAISAFRTGSLLDCAIDTAGAIVGAIVVRSRRPSGPFVQ